jgi:hypothetical protein
MQTKLTVISNEYMQNCENYSILGGKGKKIHEELVEEVKGVHVVLFGEVDGGGAWDAVKRGVPLG